jgi:hypothetical protein
LRAVPLRGTAGALPRRHLEAQRFPELGKRYYSEVVGDRLAQLTRYFDRWRESLRTTIRDPLRAARVFSLLTFPIALACFCT